MGDVRTRFTACRGVSRGSTPAARGLVERGVCPRRRAGCWRGAGRHEPSRVNATCSTHGKRSDTATNRESAHQLGCLLDCSESTIGTIKHDTVVASTTDVAAKLNHIELYTGLSFVLDPLAGGQTRNARLPCLVAYPSAVRRSTQPVGRQPRTTSLHHGAAYLRGCHRWLNLKRSALGRVRLKRGLI